MRKHRRSPALVSLAAVLLAQAPAAQKLVPEQQKFLDDTFARYDRSGDGEIARAEFPGSDAQWRDLDTDGSGAVSRAEFLASTAAKRLLLAFENNKKEPRARTDMAALARARLPHALRFDRNHDGRVEPAEWPGARTAFRLLDLNGDGAIDTRDRRLAEAAAPAALDIAGDPLRAFKQPLPGRDALLKKLDRDRDGVLVPAEVAGTDLQPVLARYDRNRDQRLDATELQVLIDQVGAAVQRRNAGTLGEVARLPDIPFGAWDKDDDGRLANAEFEAREWFARIDVDRDGYVTKEEIARARRSLEGDGFLARFDLDGDGRVTAAEFGGAPAVFRRADRNGDGAVSKQDG